LAGGVSLWAVSPRVVFPPAVFGGCPPPVLLSRVVATFLCLMCSLLSGVPAPGRPPGLRHGSGLPAPAAADQCSVLNDPGLPPRAGSEYDDLRAYGGLLCTQTEDMAQGVPSAARAREDASSMVTAGAKLTPRRGTGAHLGNQGLLCSHSHGESIAVFTWSAFHAASCTSRLATQNVPPPCVARRRVRVNLGLT